jgi:hypothetical protein
MGTNTRIWSKLFRATYLRAAVNAALDGKPVPLPHEFN